MNLSGLAFSKNAEVDTKKKDRYGRTVGKVLIAGMDVNLEQIKAGLAWHYKAYENEQSHTDRVSYAEAEEAARTAKKGLWIDLNPIPPWVFRSFKK